MKHIIRYSSKLIAVLAIGYFAFVNAGLVFATNGSATFNTDPQDRATVRVSNYTQFPNSTQHWNSSASGSAGEVISVAIYYHNTSNIIAQNTRIAINTPTGTASTFTINGSVLADNASTVNGSASIFITSAQTLSYIAGSAKWYPNQSTTPQPLPLGQSGNEIFGSGLNLGDIAPGWSAQGSVVLRFQISGNGGGGQNQPTVTTFYATGIDQNSAVLNGYVNPNNTLNTFHWFEYWNANNTGNRITTNQVSQGGSASNISESISGLQQNTTYYFRAVATNSAGIAYGSALSLTTNGVVSQLPTVTTNSASNIGQNSATMNGFVNTNTSDTTRWFEYWSSQNASVNSTNHLFQSAGSSSYSEPLFNLQQNVTYYFRAVAQNSQGVVYGSTLNFTTTGGGFSGGQLPTVTTYQATNINQSNAVLNGYISTNTNDTTRWFEYWSSQNSYVNATNHIFQGAGSANFTEFVSGLISNATYYYRAVGQNSAGISYGVTLSFNTGNFGQNNNQYPSVTTYQASNITQSGATLNGFVSTNGSSDTQRWFEYWSSQNSFVNTTSRISQGSGSSNFSDFVSGLQQNVTYYFRAVAQNSAGSSYGDTLSFTTINNFYNQPPVTIQPIVITNSATNVTRASAIVNATAFPGTTLYTSGWFEWGNTLSLGNQTATQSINNNLSTPFSDVLTGLMPNTLYYYRGVIQNQNGIARGSVLSFLTSGIFIAPPPVSTGFAGASISKEVVNLTFPNGTKSSVAAFGGDTLQFIIHTRNTGSVTLRDVTFRDKLSPFVEFKDATNGGRYDSGRGEVIWNLDLGMGESRDLKVNVLARTLPDNVVAENKATIESNDVFHASNTVIALINISPVVVSIAGDKDDVSAGDTNMYTIRYKNEGKSEVKNVELKVVLPNGADYSGSKDAQFSQKDNVLSLAVKDLAAGEEGTATFNAKLSNALKDKQSLTTTVALTYTDAFTNFERTVLAYVITTVGGGLGSLLGASLLGFLPTGGLGWLLLFMNVMALAFVFYFLMRLKREKSPVSHEAAPLPPEPYDDEELIMPSLD